MFVSLGAETWKQTTITVNTEKSLGKLTPEATINLIISFDQNAE